MLEGEIEMCGELSKVGCIEMRVGVDGKVGDLGVGRRMGGGEGEFEDG